MHLSPRDIDKLLLHGAGFLAQKRLARGLRLNYPEAVALISTQLLEFIRDGKHSVEELMDLGACLLGRAQVMAGVPEMIADVQVEGTFPDGCKLVTVSNPIAKHHGDLELALHGSFLPVPPLSLFPDVLPTVMETPGQLIVQPGELVLNEGRDVVELEVTNTGDRPIQVGSHYHFIETNRELVFDRRKAYGRRLNIPAGTAVRFEKDEVKTVPLVRIAGAQVIRGGNALASGPLSAENAERAMAQVLARNFGHKDQEET
ncbi:urease subunit gamma [Cystobacter fuscus]|uniref:urease subunit gamma n=1 Tax=Cystobacter fuscus TaxID=43 RepID=UPI002B2D4F63|nr:urease subunit gamma [Cystobacter fuscus]